MKRFFSVLSVGLFAAGLFFVGVHTTSGTDALVGEAAVAAQGGGQTDPRLALPATVAPALKSEIQAATTSAALEQVLAKHPDQGQLLVPRIEALGIAEIRRDGPLTRFVITEIEPDEGDAHSITIEAGPKGTNLSKEFPGDSPNPSFADGAVHRFVGRMPFAEILTLFGDGDKDHRLTFVTLADYGMVYLRGTGRVVLPDAEGKLATKQLGSAK